MKLNKPMITTTLSILLLSNSLFAANKIVNSQIDFVAKGNPSFIKATGELKINEAKLMLKEDIIAGEIKVDLTKLDSGIELRDSHLKEKYLHTEKYPHAVLKVKDLKLMEGKTFEGKFKAKLLFHGIEKEIEVSGKLMRKDKQVEVMGEFDLKLTDYSVELPSFQGITAADIVKIKVNTKIEI